MDFCRIANRLLFSCITRKPLKTWRIGHFAWFFEHDMSLWVKLRGRFLAVSFGILRTILYLRIAVWSIAELCWGATQWGIGSHIPNCIMQWRIRLESGPPFLHYASGFINALKNPQMNRLRFSTFMPLWLFRFFFKSVNVPSSLLFVLGIPSHSLSW